METVWIEIIKQAPSMGVLVLLVWLFLKSMENRDAMIRDLHLDHMKAREDSRTTIADNTKAMINNSTALANLVMVVHEFLGRKVPTGNGSEGK